MEHLLDPTPTTASAEVDLKDSNKYCALCAASFNNPQMALQHYNGRKHQRNAARQELLRELGDDVQEGNTESCCSAEQDNTKGIRPCRNQIKILSVAHNHTECILRGNNNMKRKYIVFKIYSYKSMS